MLEIKILSGLAENCVMSNRFPSSFKYSRLYLLTFLKRTTRLCSTNCQNMSNQTAISEHQQILRSVFLNSVQSVQPKSLFSAKRCLQISHDILSVNHDRINIAGKRCHLVGIGKAVLGIAVQIEQLFGARLKSGILSVPLGTGQKFATDSDMQLRPNSVIEVHEGAANNLPDEAAHATAAKILNFVRSLDENDVLIVAISGGGSALIPAPEPPITLEEKRNLVKELAAKEATINDINTVRIAMSLTKGGKLAVAASGASFILSLIISDVCGDPLDIIASGPTVPYTANETAVGVLRRYELYDTLPSSIKAVIERQQGANIAKPLTNASTYVIGNNTLAANTAVRDLQLKRFQAICLSTEVEGNVEILSQCYVRLARAISYYHHEPEIIFSLLKEFDCYFHFHKEAAGQLLEALNCGNGTICLVVGGEPTVRIRGNGLGGRNQELAMRISQLLAVDEKMENVTFLAAGTDGIDGPTNAAGAIGCSQVLWDFEQLLTPGERTFAQYLANNDSYHFYKSLRDGKYHVITGHTGTNVMDLHLMVIPRI